MPSFSTVVRWVKEHAIWIRRPDFYFSSVFFPSCVSSGLLLSHSYTLYLIICKMRVREQWTWRYFWTLNTLEHYSFTSGPLLLVQYPAFLIAMTYYWQCLWPKCFPQTFLCFNSSFLFYGFRVLFRKALLPAQKEPCPLSKELGPRAIKNELYTHGQWQAFPASPIQNGTNNSISSVMKCKELEAERSKCEVLRVIEM